MLERAAGDKNIPIQEQAAELKSQSTSMPPLPANQLATTQRRDVSAKIECPRFTLTLSGWFEGIVRAHGAGQLSLVVRNSIGGAIGEYSSGESAIHPLALREALNMARKPGCPYNALRSVMHYLMNEGAVQIAEHTSLNCIQQHPEIPGAFCALPPLETAVNDPDAVDFYFRAVGGGQKSGCAQLDAEIRPEHGTLVVGLESGGSEQPLQRRFIVSSPKTLTMAGAALRRHILSLSRFLVSGFHSGGVEEVAEQLAAEGFQVSELCPEKVDQQVAELRGARGWFPTAAADTETNANTGTTTLLYFGEESALLQISPDLDRDDYWVGPKVTFANAPEGTASPLTDVQLEYIRTVSRMLRSSQINDRVRGVQMLFCKRHERYPALHAEVPGLPVRESPVSLRLERSLADLHISIRSHATDVHSETPREILAAIRNPVAGQTGGSASRSGIVTLEADQPDSTQALIDSLEGRVSRIYKLQPRFVSTRVDLLHTMRMTRGFDGGMRIAAENDAGGSITALLPNTIGLDSESMNRREANLIRAFAKQLSGSWLDLQGEIERQMYGTESISKSEGGVWDGTLNGIPPLSDVPGVQAYSLASELVRWTMQKNAADSTDFSLSWLSPGQVLLFVEPPRNCPFVEIYLSGTQLTHLRFGMVGHHLGRLSLVPSLKNGRQKPSLQPVQFVPKEPLNLGPNDQEMVRRLIWSVHALQMKLDMVPELQVKQNFTEERVLPSFSDSALTEYLKKHFR